MLCAVYLFSEINYIGEQMKMDGDNEQWKWICIITSRVTYKIIINKINIKNKFVSILIKLDFFFKKKNQQITIYNNINCWLRSKSSDFTGDLFCLTWLLSYENSVLFCNFVWIALKHLTLNDKLSKGKLRKIHKIKTWLILNSMSYQ